MPLRETHTYARRAKKEEHDVEIGKLKEENAVALAQAQQDANGRVDAVKQSFKSFRLEEAAETLGLNIENGCDDHTRQLINIYLWFISERVNDEASAEFVRRFTALDQTISACYQKNGDQLADMRAKMQEVINKRNEDQGSRIRIEWPSEGEKYDDMKHTRKNDSGLTIESVSSAYIYSLKPDGSQECLCTASVTTQR